VASAAFLKRFSYIYSGETKWRLFYRICHCNMNFYLFIFIHINEERTGKCLLQVDHICGHLWHRYSVRVNRVMVASEKLQPIGNLLILCYRITEIFKMSLVKVAWRLLHSLNGLAIFTLVKPNDVYWQLQHTCTNISVVFPT
jgi:hypothetical protein